jgi:hypothetical protein
MTEKEYIKHVMWYLNLNLQICPRLEDIMYSEYYNI